MEERVLGNTFMIICCALAYSTDIFVPEVPRRAETFANFANNQTDKYR